MAENLLTRLESRHGSVMESAITPLGKSNVTHLSHCQNDLYDMVLNTETSFRSVP